VSPLIDTDPGRKRRDRHSYLPNSPGKAAKTADPAFVCMPPANPSSPGV
jgi:hypothetical protein